MDLIFIGFIFIILWIDVVIFMKFVWGGKRNESKRLYSRKVYYIFFFLFLKYKEKMFLEIMFSRKVIVFIIFKLFILINYEFSFINLLYSDV